MASVAVSLVDYAGDVIVPACSICDRRGRYRKAALVAAHDVWIDLPDLCMRIAADCPRVRDKLGNDRYGAHCLELGTPHR